MGGGKICGISCDMDKNREFLKTFYGQAKTNLQSFFGPFFFRHFALAERRY